MNDSLSNKLLDSWVRAFFNPFLYNWFAYIPLSVVLLYANDNHVLNRGTHCNFQKRILYSQLPSPPPLPEKGGKGDRDLTLSTRGPVWRVVECSFAFLLSHLTCANRKCKCKMRKANKQLNVLNVCHSILGSRWRGLLPLKRRPLILSDDEFRHSLWPLNR